MILARFPTRIVELVMDGAYATKAWRGLPDRVTVTTRMRANAAVFALAPPRTGKRGRPALKGARLASLAKLAEQATFTAVTVTGPDGKTRVEHVWRTTCLWYGPFYTRPVVVILIRKPDRSDGLDGAIASTDTTASTAELIARYDSRWTIETAHQQAKAHGAGQARNRVQKAVERTVPFGFMAQTITIAWYALHGDPDADIAARRQAAPWYRHKQTVSYADMLARATPRPDPPPILGTSTRPDQHTTNHADLVTVSARRRVRSRKSSSEDQRSRATSPDGWEQQISAVPRRGWLERVRPVADLAADEPGLARVTDAGPARPPAPGRRRPLPARAGSRRTGSHATDRLLRLNETGGPAPGSPAGGCGDRGAGRRCRA